MAKAEADDLIATPHYESNYPMNKTTRHNLIASAIAVLLAPLAALASLHAANPGVVAPETSEGWKKFGNPVMGSKHGTCFVISVLKEGETYRMWLSWRPKQSVALVESKDGTHWSEPPVTVLSPRKTSGWEDDIRAKP